VWVEWSEADKDQIKNAKDIVRKSFDEVCEQKKENTASIALPSCISAMPIGQI
jgi:hypothetical protein